MESYSTSLGVLNYHKISRANVSL